MDDSNGDGRLNKVEGTPAHGPIVASLTTTGDTSPASSLAVSRFPLAIGGVLKYSRDNIDFTGVAGAGYSAGTVTAKEIADAVRNGKGVVVIHAINYDGNGKYSFGQLLCASELEPSLPAEATGLLHDWAARDTSCMNANDLTDSILIRSEAVRSVGPRG